ncbi:hypothetical protein SAMN05880566_12634 [Janthinobacterium sp. TND4EL3]|nr:hypothetical protein SAMN05880566_12634 [Janthinobacterium sp. TND4EL3]
MYTIMQQWPVNTGGIGWLLTDDTASYTGLPVVPCQVLRRLGTAHVAPDGPLAAQDREPTNPQVCDLGRQGILDFQMHIH